MVKYIGNAPTAVPLTSADITDGIISNSKLAQDIISADTEETSIATDDTILIHDTSASALRKMTRANFVSGIGGANTPIVVAGRSGSSQTISSGSYVKIELNDEILDTGSIYDTSTYTITIGETAKYFIGASMQVTGLNGTSDMAVMRVANSSNSSSKRYINIAVSGNSGYGYGALAGQTIRTISAGDTVCLFVYGSEGIGVPDENVQLVLYKMIE